MCAENGPSLCLGCQLCWGIELQVFPSFLGTFPFYQIVDKGLLLSEKSELSVMFFL